MLKMTNDLGNAFCFLDWRYQGRPDFREGSSLQESQDGETQLPTLPTAFENLGHVSLCVPFVCQAGHKKQNQVPGS